MDKISQRIEKALPIIKSYLKRHPVPLKVFDTVFQTLRISLWKSIKKQENTHQGWKLVHLFEWQARSDLKDEYYLEPFIRVPAKKVYDQEWKDKNMPHIFWIDEKEADSPISDIFSNNELSPEQSAIFNQTLNNMTDKEKIVLQGRYKGQTFKEIGKFMGLQSELMPLQIMNGIRVKWGISEPVKPVESKSVTARKKRNVQIIKLRQKGLTQHQISRNLDIPRTTIQNILKQVFADRQ